ncbi:conjugative relaxase (plasmid) [Legionella geestiana]|uniref:MobF family relaxase n=1 Tax=Legionella geestiana TaxID=45065 RepID=UPI0010927516|nr:MobF family relaxase [Legionella geestiana]QDQ41210.1 conjugative relaxase [Legionella geestiana]
MLSIQPLKSAQGAADYYTAAFNYYAGDATAMRWLGEGAAMLGLSGRVEKDMMLSLLQGRLPNGQELKNPKGEHRPGFDMTFSAPKSVSLLVGLGVAPQLLEYHDRAVAFAVARIEKEFAEARVLREGVSTFEKTGNLIMAAFRQPSSRANDPDIHTHCVTMNMTMLEGRAKSLASDIHANNGVIEQLQRNAIYAGLLYRNHLANLLKADNFSLRCFGEGLFEIEGIPEQVLRQFSTRRVDIEAQLDATGMQGAKAASRAALATRQGKEETDLTVLESQWAERAHEMGFDARQFVDNRHAQLKSKNRLETLAETVKGIFFKPVEREAQDAMEAVEVAMEVLSQKTSVFTERALLTESLKHALTSMRPVGLEAIERTISQKKKSDELYEARCPYTDKPMLTTPWLLTLEAETIARIEKNKGTVTSIASRKDVEAFQKQIDAAREHPLTHSQKQAMLSLLTSEDRFIAVQGYAGVAKTTMLAFARQMMEEKGFMIRGITVASSAAHEMTAKAGIHADVFPKVFGELQKARKDSLTNTIFIVDEASMLSSPQGHALAKLVEEKGARLAFVGDEAQLPSVKNGRIFGLVQDYGVHTATMDEIVRQKDTRLREAVTHATRGEIYDALEKVSNVTEFATHEERIGHLAKTWLDLVPEERAKTLLFAPTHQNRRAITSILREGLEKEGVLSGKELSQQVLKTRSLEEVQLRFTGYYEKGNVIRFNQDFRRSSIKSGEYFEVGTISAKHRKDNVLPLVRENGRTLLFPLRLLPQYKTHTAGFSRIMEVYEKAELNLKQGETVLWCRNFSADGIRNSERATLNAIREHSLDFVLENGENLTLEKKHPALRHIDHGYVMTNYKVQGKDAFRGMGLIESGNRFSATLKNFYVQISRAVNTMTIVTDDRTKLVRALELNDDDKKSAIDALNTAQLEKHATRFEKKSHVDMQAILDKKALRDAVWERIVSKADNWLEARQQGHQAIAAKSAHALLSSPEGMRIARARIGKGLSTLRQDALKIETLRLTKTLHGDARTHFLQVKKYVALNKVCAKATKSLHEAEPAASPQARENTLKLAQKRNALAFALTQNLDAYRPFLNHFSIGSSNRLGVPQHRYMEENKKALARLEKLADHATRHQLSESVSQFCAEKNIGIRETLARMIREDAKRAHPFVLQAAQASGKDAAALWQDIRTHARELDDKDFRAKLSPAEMPIFDLAKQYKILSMAVSRSWKSVYSAEAKGGALSPALAEPLTRMDAVKRELASALMQKSEAHQKILTYFNIETSKLNQQATMHQKEQLIALFKKPTGNFQEKHHAALVIAEDIRGFYPHLKRMDVDMKRLGTFMRTANREQLLQGLTAPERAHYRSVLVYKQLSRESARAWKASMDATKNQKPSKALQEKAIILSARRDEAAFHLQDVKAYGLALQQESVAVERLQLHASNHLQKLREVRHLQEWQQGLLNQLTKNTGMKTPQATALLKQWGEIESQLCWAEKTPQLAAVRKGRSLRVPVSESLRAILETVRESRAFEPEKTVQHRKKSMPNRHAAVQRLDAATVNDALMANPEATYRAIFGEPKKISGKVMDYPGGLKVTIKGSKAGLWNHFGEGKGGAPLQAIMFAHGVDFREALQMGAEISGMAGMLQQSAARKREEPLSPINEHAERAGASALSIWKGTKPLAKSPAAVYLKQYRAITSPETLKDIRFWPAGAKWQRMNENGELVTTENRLPVLAIAARNASGEITAVQRVYLDAKTSEKNRFMKAAKLSSGIMKGSAAVIQTGKASGKLYVAEGPETGASIAIADPKATVLVAFSVSNLGNLAETIKNYKPSQVIIAADNDGKSGTYTANTRKTTENAAQKFRENGLNAVAIYPKMLPGLKKTDWNDVLTGQGVESVRRQLGVISHPIREIQTSLYSRISNILEKNIHLPAIEKPSNINASGIPNITAHPVHKRTSGNIRFPTQSDLLLGHTDVQRVMDMRIHNKSETTLGTSAMTHDKVLIKEMEI